MFEVPWVDDQRNIQVNRGYRVQFNNAIGLYNRGFRFHPGVNHSILKFLGFEQIFKNRLIFLSMAGAKGANDFEYPEGKSYREFMHFCQSFMLELWKMVGPEMDVPAVDIGLGALEITYLYGSTRNLFTNIMLSLKEKELSGVALSIALKLQFSVSYILPKKYCYTRRDHQMQGSSSFCLWNVAWEAITKATQMGAKVVNTSGPNGYMNDPEAISGRKIDYLLKLRASNQDICKPYIYKFPNAQCIPNTKPWEVKCDDALFCATQNELDKDDVINHVKNGCICVAESANMPFTPEAIEVFLGNDLLFSPGNASNAGGVAVFCLENF